MSHLNPMESIHFCIILSLAEGPKSPAAIHRQVRHDSGIHAVYLQLSTICKVLQKLEQRQMVEKSAGPHTRSSTYELTAHGRRLLKFETNRLTAACQLAGARLSI